MIQYVLRSRRLDHQEQSSAERRTRSGDSQPHDWTCITCGKQPRDEYDRRYFDGGHYKPEGIYKSVQFDLFNVNCQCRGCNRGMHGNYGLYAEALIKKYGIEEFNALIERSKKTKAWTEQELLTLIVAIRNPNNYTEIYNKLLNRL